MATGMIVEGFAERISGSGGFAGEFVIAPDGGGVPFAVRYSDPGARDLRGRSRVRAGFSVSYDAGPTNIVIGGFSETSNIDNITLSGINAVATVRGNRLSWRLSDPWSP